MKKVLGIIIAMAMLITLTTVNVSAAGSVVGTLNGSVGATGTWDGNVEKVADGDSLEIELSGDAYGFIFENLEPGIYKIAYYMDLETIATGKQMRISPRVTNNGANEHRCWVDFRTDAVLENLSENDADADEDGGKIVLVAVITVPEGYNRIDVGAWQDSGAYVGLLDKVVLATGDYAFPVNGEYALGNEIGNTGTFGEDSGNLLHAADGWVNSFEAVVDGGEEGDGDINVDEGNGDEGNADAGNDDAGNDEDNGTTDAPQTGDVSALLALVAAGAAAFGGLKLRKR